MFNVQLETNRLELYIYASTDKGILEFQLSGTEKSISGGVCACEESQTIQKVIEFVNYLKENFLEELKQTNKENKATVGTFFSARYPQNAMRSFGRFISKIDWSKSDSLKKLFGPFEYIGKEKLRV